MRGRSEIVVRLCNLLPNSLLVKNPIENSVMKSIEAHGLELPKPSVPGGSYASVNVRENVAYVAIQFPIRNGEFLYQGVLGENISTRQGIEAMQLCALNVLAQIHHKLGFENVLGINHLDAYYRSAPSWDDAPIVVDGASDLFLNVLAQKGQHSRAIVGVAALPRSFSVGLTASFTLKKA